MAENRAGGILVSSFVAGALLAAAVFAPSAWEPVPGPYFGLDEQAAGHPASAAAPDPGMEAAHAELSARANAAPANAVPASDASAAADPAAPAQFDDVPPPSVRSAVPPERVAVAETTSVAAVAALAGTLPVPVTNPATAPTGPAAAVPDTPPLVAATRSEEHV